LPAAPPEWRIPFAKGCA